MIKVVVASKNPVKLEATRIAFQQFFRNEKFSFLEVDAPSFVSHQPVGDHETFSGAYNRVGFIKEHYPDGDYWVGIEGGVQFENENEMCAFAWVVIMNKDLCGKARTGTFYLPPEIVRLVKDGKELGEADDIVFQQSNSKQKNGAIGLLTGDVLTRSGLYEQAVVLALIPFRNKQLFKPV
jgi:inosine/xanthosine triphosphatase